MLRGSATARIDDKGRLKVPNWFRSLIEKDHGRDLFVTSLTGDSVLVYPMPVWLALEQRLAQMPSTHPARTKFLDRVNYFGLEAELDTQGRVIIPPRLRDVAQIAGDVDVLGKHTFLEVWNHERFVARMASDPFTSDDAKELSGFGI